MNNQCPACTHPVTFWQKFNTSRLKPAVCEGCGKRLSVAHHLFGLAAAVCIPVILRHFALKSGIAFPLWIQLLLPIPLLYVIFQFLLPLVELPDVDEDGDEIS